MLQETEECVNSEMKVSERRGHLRSSHKGLKEMINKLGNVNVAYLFWRLRSITASEATHKRSLISQ
jgi:hypothetical protein